MVFIQWHDKNIFKRPNHLFSLLSICSIFRMASTTHETQVIIGANWIDSFAGIKAPQMWVYGAAFPIFIISLQPIFLLSHVCVKKYFETHIYKGWCGRNIPLAWGGSFEGTGFVHFSFALLPCCRNGDLLLSPRPSSNHWGEGNLSYTWCNLYITVFWTSFKIKLWCTKLNKNEIKIGRGWRGSK